MAQIRQNVQGPDTRASDVSPSNFSAIRQSALPGAPAGDIAELYGRPAARVRLCVLCGGPLRAGQRITRIQGSTVHARCSATTQ